MRKTLASLPEGWQALVVIASAIVAGFAARDYVRTNLDLVPRVAQLEAQATSRDSIQGARDGAQDAALVAHLEDFRGLYTQVEYLYCMKRAELPASDPLYMNPMVCGQRAAARERLSR